MAKKVDEYVAHHTRMSGLDNIINLTGRFGDLERMVGYIQDMLKELGKLMMGIVNGSIPVAGRQGS